MLYSPSAGCAARRDVFEDLSAVCLAELSTGLFGGLVRRRRKERNGGSEVIPMNDRKKNASLSGDRSFREKDASERFSLPSGNE